MREYVAVITGGMGGIGTAICKALYQMGAYVVVGYYRNGDHKAARKWQEEQKKIGLDFAINFVNVADYQSCCEFASQVEEQFGKIDILVNNAGITHDRVFYKTEPVFWQEVLRTNLEGVFNLSHRVLPGMLERHYGRIINISSINGQKGQVGQTNYAAAKAGIHGFTKSLALEVAKKGITVNTVSPGYIATNMVMAVPEEVREKIVAEIPVGRLGMPEEVARAVAFLAAKESSFITGTNLMINGGQYLL